MTTIKLTTVEITADCVYFTTDCTTYANERRTPTHSIKGLLRRLTALVKVLKAGGCVVSYANGTRKHAAENHQAYYDALKVYNSHFDTMVTLAQAITGKPLPMGTSDNVELAAMYDARNACTKMQYRSAIISQINDFAARVASVEQAIEDGTQYTKVIF